MSYILDTLTINMPSSANNPIINNLLQNYTYGKQWNINFTENDNLITMGDYKEAELNGKDCVINITDNGMYIKGIDFPSVMHGFITFLEAITYSEENDFFYLENKCTYEKPVMNFRCVHLCIFPETELEFFRKCVLSCAIAKYSHIIFEFWGMIKFDCLKELAWPFAFSKNEIKAIVSEANALGVEIIPMFNHLGHASACREVNGKHVVLDQNPKYEYMFDSYGWVWNFKKKAVYELLKNIRKELIEVCGKGSYFNLGCDEAYAFGHNEKGAKEVANYLNKVSNELKTFKRRAIIWHDMLLSQEECEGYIANSNKACADIITNNLSKDIIIADWQYHTHDEIWKSTDKFKDNNFDVVCCPWDNKQNIDEAIETVNTKSLLGIIHTTWHTLFKGFREMVYAGVMSYGTDAENTDDVLRFYCARVARMVMPSHGDYENCGWSEKMTGPGLR